MANHNHIIRGTPIEECGFDDTTLKLVHLSRCYFSAYAAGATPDCETAVEMCKEKFGQTYAVEIAMGLLCVLSAMRTSRKSTFQFNHACCEKCRNRITQSERLLFSTLASIRQNNRSQAYVTALMLCEGYETDELFKTMEQLSRFLDRAEN
ncbi:MAG: hypothetical protein AAF478_03885 [Pseudomonadota bacterium]